MKIGWAKSGVMCSDTRTTDIVCRRIEEIFSDVKIPNVTEGYKYLGV